MYNGVDIRAQIEGKKCLEAYKKPISKDFQRPLHKNKRFINSLVYNYILPMDTFCLPLNIQQILRKKRQSCETEKSEEEPSKE